MFKNTPVTIDRRSSRCEFHGVDFGGSSHPTVVAWNKAEGYLVVKVDGGKYWSGLGQPWAYAPARFITFKIRDISIPDEDRIVMHLDQVIETPIRSQPLDLRHKEA